MEKKEIFDAYHMRRHNLSRLKEEADTLSITADGENAELDASSEIPDEDLGSIIETIQGDGLSYHTYENIGCYTVFPHNHYKRMFPSKAFGNIE